jgi:mRNA-degrading endonuclease toxin of MazEF toxin-antitoxin module
MQPGEIFIAKFPFGDVPGMKLRPVLLLTETVGPIPEAVVAYISSVQPSQILSSDLVIDPSKREFANTHLKTISVLRLRKLATIHSASIVRFLGVLNDDQKSQVDTKLRNLLKL